ncbi:MAG: potassium-transporting ATPase subunit C, partial [Holophaga sp.]
TAPFPTNAAASGGSTLAASNPTLAQAVTVRMRILKAVDPDNSAPLPQDLITASASGLDPHIFPESAHWQVARIARNRGLTTERVKNLVAQHVQRSLFGPPRVNVLELNLALDAQAHP